MILHRFASIPGLSTEYVTVEVEARRRGRRVNLTSTAVQFAFTAEGSEPGVGDWHAGVWEALNGTYLAMCLVGPGAGGVPLGDGRWLAWVRVVSNPEQPARLLGILEVT